MLTLEHLPGRLVVQLSHAADHCVILSGLHHAGLVAGGEYAGADGFGHYQHISGDRAHIAQHLVRVHIAGNAHTVLGLRILYGVAACDHTAGLHSLVVATLQDLADRLLAQTVGHTQQIHRHGGLPAHSVHITEGIGRGDLPEPVGIVHHRGEEVHRVDGCNIIGEFVDTGIIRRVVAYDQLGIKYIGKICKNFRKDTRPQLGRSAGCCGHLGQRDLFSHERTHSLMHNYRYKV